MQGPGINPQHQKNQQTKPQTLKSIKEGSLGDHEWHQTESSEYRHLPKSQGTPPPPSHAGTCSTHLCKATCSGKCSHWRHQSRFLGSDTGWRHTHLYSPGSCSLEEEEEEKHIHTQTVSLSYSPALLVVVKIRSHRLTLISLGHGSTCSFILVWRLAKTVREGLTQA